MTEQEAKTLFQVTHLSEEEDWEDAYQARLFDWRNYLLRQAVVPPLFQKRIHNLLRLEEAAQVLIPELPVSSRPPTVENLFQQAQLSLDNPSLRIRPVLPEHHARILPLASPTLEALVKAYGNRISILKLGIASAPSPRDVAAFAVALVTAELTWIGQIVPLFAAVAHQVPGIDADTIKVGQPVDPAEWLASVRYFGMIGRSLEPKANEDIRMKMNFSDPKALEWAQVWAREIRRLEKIHQLKWG